MTIDEIDKLAKSRDPKAITDALLLEKSNRGARRVVSALTPLIRELDIQAEVQRIMVARKTYSKESGLIL